MNVTARSETDDSSSKRSVTEAWSGVVAATCAFVGLFLIFWFTPMTNTDDAARELSRFYGDETKRLALLIAEPLALVATAAFILMFGRLANQFRIAGEASTSSVVLAGGVTFAALLLVGMVADTVIAGTMSFTKAFIFDPDLAMVLAHFGYVTKVGAAVAAGVVAGTAGAAIRRGSIGTRSLGTFGYVVAAIAVVSLFFVYLPLVLFLIWALFASLKLRAPA